MWTSFFRVPGAALNASCVSLEDFASTTSKVRSRRTRQSVSNSEPCQDAVSAKPQCPLPMPGGVLALALRARPSADSASRSFSARKVACARSSAWASFAAYSAFSSGPPRGRVPPRRPRRPCFRPDDRCAPSARLPSARFFASAAEERRRLGRRGPVLRRRLPLALPAFLLLFNGVDGHLRFAARFVSFALPAFFPPSATATARSPWRRPSSPDAAARNAVC